MKIMYGIWCFAPYNCYQDENRWWRTGFETEEEARNKIKEFLFGHSGYPVSSQHAKRGRYTIYKFQVEQLPDGRLITGTYINTPGSFWNEMPEDIRFSLTTMPVND